MKKQTKCALGLVAMLAAVSALSACDLATADSNGVIFTYTNAAGYRTSYTAQDLLTNYRSTSTSLSTEFDKVYEVLVRHYYDQAAQKSDLATCVAKAQGDVLADKETAKKNSSSTSSYEAEFQKILDNHSCKNVQELYEYHLYEEEKSLFQESIYQTWATGNTNVNGLEAMRDGEYTVDGTTTKIMQASDKWGIGSEGWIKDQMPTHYRHILVKFTAAAKSGEFCQDQIGESTTAGEGGETTHLANTLIGLAGGNYTTDTTTNKTTISALATRPSFGELALQYSDDNGTPNSAKHQGETSLVTKVMSQDFVPEFKLGAYAYESLFNKRESATDYGKANIFRITPGLKESTNATDVATKTYDLSSFVDDNQKLDDTGTPVYTYLKDNALGEIPFGAALALADYSKIIKDSAGHPVNENNAAYYPRNVIFNKYFNKHNICVITPNAIWSNKNSSNADTVTAANGVADTYDKTTGAVTAQNFTGAYTSEYGNLPGFQVNTQDILPQYAHNVLTNSEGQVILATRVSSSGYQGIHFIVVQRSALSQYGISYDSASKKYVENGTQVTATPTINQYYTTYTPSSSKYPTDTSNSEPLTTYVNYNATEVSDWNTRSGTVSTAIKGFNSNLNTYQFQLLFDSGSITFNDTTLEAQVKNYSQTKRQSSVDTAFTTWSDNWKKYAELLETQEEYRQIGRSDGRGYLLSETTAVQYYDPADRENNALWTKGGACYYGTLN